MKDTAVVSFGRFNSPTIGHAHLIDTVIGTAKLHKGDPIVYASHTEDNKKNPLSYETKIAFLNKVSGGVIKKDPQSKVKNIFDLLKVLNGQHKNIIVVAGSDRVNEYETSLRKYNGKDYTYASINVVSAGQRDPDSDDAIGSISGTKMREFAINNDFKSFKEFSFAGGSEQMVRTLFDEIRKKYKLTENYTMLYYCSLIESHT